MLSPLMKEFRLIAVKGKTIVELEDGYVSWDTANQDIPFYQKQYPDHNIIVETY